MLIAFDEYGTFEQASGKKAFDKLAFIAGLLYDNADANDLNNERKRIIKYYEKVCAEINLAHFPEALHVNQEVSNSPLVAQVKNKVQQTISEFLRYGTYGKKPLSQPPRKGHYQLFLQVKSGKGKSELLQKNTNFLLKDDYGSNLYVHMAQDVLARTIFHNPYQQVQYASFDLPTRQTKATDMREITEAGHLGYNGGYKKGNQLSKYRQVTDASTYRTIITHELLAGNHYDVYIGENDFHVMPIQYTSKKGGELLKEMAFLYLADSICSFFAHQKNELALNTFLDNCDEQARKLNGSKQNLIFAYDSLDTFYQRAWGCCERRQYFEALSIVFAVRKEYSEDKLFDFYNKNWFKLIEDYVQSKADTAGLEIAVKRCQQYANSNHMQPEKLRYIFEQLEQAVQKSGFSLLKNTAFNLYDVGFSAYNHFGQIEKAMQCWKKCQNLAPYTDIELYFNTWNKYIVFLSDSLQFSKAKNEVEELVLYASDLQKIRQDVFKNNNGISPIYGRSLSQYGQVRAFLGEQEAEKTFLDALKQYGPNTPDYFQTFSYLLHYYIAEGNKERYDSQAKIYFGDHQKLKDQLKYLMTENQKKTPLLSLSFAFFVFLKGAYYFHREEIQGDLRVSLLDIEAFFRRYHAEDRIGGHPWELIYKYLAFFANKWSKPDKAEEYLKKMQSAIQTPSNIIQAIIHNGRREFFVLTHDEENEYVETAKVLDILQSLQISGDGKDMLAKLRYMYD